MAFRFEECEFCVFHGVEPGVCEECDDASEYEPFDDDGDDGSDDSLEAKSKPRIILLKIAA